MSRDVSPARDSATLWGPVARSGFGRPATHSRDEITAAAVAVADTDGLAAVSIRRVAAAVGAGAMSLYSYVPDKETLIELMIDRVAGEVELTEPTGHPLDDLRDYARSLRAMMRRHSWLSAALVARQTIGPNTLAGMDHVLAILAATDLATPAKLELQAVLTGMVANYTLYEVAQVERARRTGRSPAESAAAEVAYLVRAAQSGQYPHLAAALIPSPAEPASTKPPSKRANRPAPNGPIGAEPRSASVRGAAPDMVFDRLVERVIGGLLEAPPT